MEYQISPSYIQILENSLLEGEPEVPEEPIANMEAPPMVEAY